MFSTLPSLTSDSAAGCVHFQRSMVPRDDDDGDIPSLSPEAAAALRAFALAQGIAVDTAATDDDNEGAGEDDAGDLISAVRDHFDVKDKDETFKVEYMDDGYNEELGAMNTADLRCIRFEVKGVKRSLGQTLSSTGLTIWRAAEHLCEFIFRHPERFCNRTVVELGCGLGMVSILLHKMAVAAAVVATDGDDATMDLLRGNLAATGCTDGVDAHKLYWGDAADTAALLAAYPARFDVVIASDVIYEKEQVTPSALPVLPLLPYFPLRSLLPLLPFLSANFSLLPSTPSLWISPSLNRFPLDFSLSPPPPLPHRWSR